MKYIIIILGCLCFLPGNSLAQNNLKVSGEITDDLSQPVKNCFLKIYKPNNKVPLKYLLLGNSNNFSFTINSSGFDTLYLSVSKLGKQDFMTLIKVTDETDQHHFNIKLLPEAKRLDEIILNASPFWKVGDTSFYRVSAYEKNNEKKLGELITKIPGFTIDSDRRLRFKQKPVEKILIEGEDLFSDKHSLLLDHFPLDAIENLQAIENQTNQPLLKGLTNESKIFVNLQLKKKSLKAAFGSTEIGISTEKKYMINPVIFALYGKIKAGYIGNNNSEGLGSGTIAENELKNKEIKYVENWMPKLLSFQNINDLNSRHYITNKLWDNRLKINLPINKKLNTETELIFLKDHRNQQVSEENIFINDAALITQNKTTRLSYQPQKTLLKQGLQWQVNQQNQIKGSVLIYLDKTNQQVQYIQTQLNYLDSSEDQNKNNYQSVMTHISYTGRINDLTAVQFDINYGKHHYTQYAGSFSNSLPLLFNINDSLNIINLNRKATSENIEATLTLFKKARKKIIKPSLFFNYQKDVITNDFVYGSTLNKKDSLSAAFTGTGNFKNYTLGVAYAYAIKIANLKLQQSIQIGVAQFQENRVASKKTSTHAIGAITLNWKKNKYKTKQEISLSFNRNQLSLPEINSAVFPIKTTYFNLHIITQHSVSNNLHSLYYVGKQFKKQRSISAILSYGINLNSPVYKNQYYRFLLVSIDSISNKITHYATTTVYYNFSLPSIKANAILQGSYNNYDQLLWIGEKIKKTNTHVFKVNLEVSKNYQKKHFFELSTYLQHIFLNYPNVVNQQNLNNHYTQAQIGLTYEYRLNKKWSYFLDGKILSKNILLNNNRPFIFANSALAFTPNNSKFRFTVLADNITNLHFYQNSYALPPYFTSTNIPLIVINFQAKIYYGF